MLDFRTLSVASCLLAGVLFVPVETYAQDAPCTHYSCSASPPHGGACRIYFDAGDGDITLNTAALRGTVTGIPRAQPEGCYDPARLYGLQGWRYNMRGGHKLRQMTFLQGGGTMRFALVDHDGGDYADGFVWVVPLPLGTVRRSVSSRCRGRCGLALDQKAADEVVVLTGFDFHRDENDGHIKRIVVDPYSGTERDPIVEVEFSDDDFPYDVTLQYAFLSSEVAHRPERVAGSFERWEPGFGGGVIRSASVVDPNLRARTGRGDSVLMGFSFIFQNGGHFIEDIGLERRLEDYEAWYQDNQNRAEIREPDDPFDWIADYVFLR